MTVITSIEALEALYDTPGEASLVKEADRITPPYRRLIEASPFVALATCGPEGLDCSPRGELGGVVHIEDERTLMLPDRRGNNRIDSLRNVVRDPRVGLLFLIPGSGSTLRVNGRACLSADAALLQRFAVPDKLGGKLPRTVMVIAVETVFFQCARAIVRSALWDPAHHVDAKALPTPGQILAELSQQTVGGAAYDEEWPERARGSLW
ncbi:MAG TPA: pyridoxamine 5'-phosphate oxidase family protein [Kiloniellaceae bacterium]